MPHHAGGEARDDCPSEEAHRLISAQLWELPGRTCQAVEHGVQLIFSGRAEFGCASRTVINPDLTSCGFSGVYSKADPNVVSVAGRPDEEVVLTLIPFTYAHRFFISACFHDDTMWNCQEMSMNAIGFAGVDGDSTAFHVQDHVDVDRGFSLRPAGVGDGGADRLEAGVNLGRVRAVSASVARIDEGLAGSRAQLAIDIPH